MPFHGRTRETGAIRAALDDPRASVLWVTGPRGVGKTALVLHALDPGHLLYLATPPLPAPRQRDALARRLGPGAHAAVSDGGWPGLLDVFAAGAPVGQGPPRVLVLDDAHRLRQSRSRIADALVTLLERARADDRRLHVVLVGAPGTLPDSPKLDLLTSARLSVGPLPLRAARPMLPGTTPRDLIRSYSVFGGSPRILGLLDKSVSLTTNLRRLILDSSSTPLRDFGVAEIEREALNPSRYLAVLSTLARGEAEWGKVREGVPDLTTSGQLAPYLQRLEEGGWIEVRRSLDAAPSSRARRYRIIDPFAAFWFAFLLEAVADIAAGAGAGVLADRIRPDLDRHVGSIFPSLCRQYLSNDAIELLGTNAREAGSLWSAEVDLPVAGILRNGAACYGIASWSALGAGALADLDAQVRETRYGYGRERRARLLFSGTQAGRGLAREIARRDDAFFIGAEDLVGTA